MMCKKKKSGIYMHPVLTVMVVGFAVIGVCGVASAVKKKACALKEVAKTIGCECVHSVSEKAEEMMQSGMQAAERMMGDK